MSIRDRLLAVEIQERLAAIEELTGQGRADDAEVEALLHCLESERKVLQRRAADCFAVLGRHGLPVRSLLLASLRSPHTRRRWGAAFALASMGPVPREALPILVETLGADDGDVRWAAAEILVNGGPALGVHQELLRLLRQGTAVQRKMAAYCLRDLGARSAEIEALLLERLTDGDTAVRLAVVAALARNAYAPATVAQRVAMLLDDADAGVRRAAAAALGPLGDASRSVLTALRLAADAPDAGLQRAATRSLRMLEG